MRADITYSMLMKDNSDYDVEKAAKAGRDHARDMILSIVQLYDSKPVIHLLL